VGSTGNESSEPGDPAAAAIGDEVTFVVSDLKGSTALAETLDPESLREVLDQYFDELGAVLESYGGRIEKRIGDMILTVFGVPEPAPDDAIRALRAVAEAQRTLASLNDRLEATWGVRLTNRTGVCTGPVESTDAGGGHLVLAGPALDGANSLEPAAPALEALVAESTVAAAGEGVEVDDPVTVELRSGTGEIVAYRLVSVPAGDDTERATTGTTGGADTRTSRRTLTIVFSDIRPAPGGPPPGSAEARVALARAFDAMRAILEHHGATVEKFIGDAVMAVFGLARRNEDDALRAVRAALEMQERLRPLNDELDAELGIRLEQRIGVNTGPVIAGDPALGQRLVTGDTVNVAARLEQTAANGDVVMGELTRRLAGDATVSDELEPLRLKGKAEPVPAHRVREVRAGAAATTGRFELPFEGRAAELAALESAFAAVRADAALRRISIVGDAGLGKSRLVYELLDRLEPRPRTLRGACLAYGEGITFWPVLELVQNAAGIGGGDDVATTATRLSALVGDDEVVARLGSLLGLGDTTYPVGEIFWAVRRLLEHLAANGPLVVVVDGLHWAEPTLRDLLEHLESVRGPVLLVTMERPEEGTTTARGTRIDLAPLGEEACRALIDSVLAGGSLPGEVEVQVLRAAAGNPLFLDQLLSMLIEEGRLERRGDRWTATSSLDDLRVPPSIEALLAARIDSLGDDERGALEPASVIGREFPRAAVAALSGADPAAAIDLLVRRQLVTTVRDPGTFADHRFRNLLIRDVAYEGLLKRSRAVLHERFADWLESMAAFVGRLTELEEILGYHLEQAYLLRAQLGAVDESTVEVGRRAAARLAAAGERAFVRGDMPAAANLLGRAAATLAESDPRVTRLLIRCGEALLETGAFADATQRYDDAERIALEQGEPVSAALAELARVTLRYLTGGGVDGQEALAVADRLHPLFEQAGDHRGAAWCWRLRAYVELTGCRWGPAEQAAERMIEHARRANDTVLEQRVLPALAQFSVYGPTPVTDALERCRQILDAIGSDRRAKALTERAIAHLLALDGRADEGRELCAATRASLLDLGWNFDAALVSINLGPIELLAGREFEAERELRRDYEVLKEMGEQNYISTTAALLAEAVRRQGRPDEALELVTFAESVAGDEDVLTLLQVGAVRARVATSDGRRTEAVRVARETVALAMTTDAPSAQAEALLDLAEAAWEAGDLPTARESCASALTRFRDKGDRPGEARAAHLLTHLHRPTPGSGPRK
jgi:class 3 adenylate cyclase/tetratricopeptide (TPR) repeat protein